MEHDLTSTAEPVQAIEAYTENRSPEVVVGSAVDPNMATALGRHPWLSHMTENERIALVYGTDRGHMDAWVADLPRITLEELRAAFDDPALRGLYIAPWSAERVDAELTRRKVMGWSLPPDDTDAAAWFRDEVEIRALLTTWASRQQREWLRGTELERDELLAEYNHKFTVIGNYHGKCVVSWWEGDRLHTQDFTNWAQARDNKSV